LLRLWLILLILLLVLLSLLVQLLHFVALLAHGLQVFDVLEFVRHRLRCLDVSPEHLHNGEGKIENDSDEALQREEAPRRKQN
jgi:hypothetical protein